MKRLLHWFWAPLREGENWAQTLIRVLGSLFRIALTLALALAAAIAATVYLEGEGSRQRERQARLISVEAITGIEGENSNGCSADFPIAIVVRNHSSLALMSTDIDVTARLPGTSSNLLGYEGRIRWDHIVPPEHELVLCYRVGRTPVDGSAVYSASAVSYSMVLQPSENWMLSETLARPTNRFGRYVLDPPAQPRP